MESVLEFFRGEQEEGSERSVQHFVLNFSVPSTGQGLGEKIGARTGLRVAEGPLFGPDPDLDRFRLLAIPGVSRPDRADLFEIALVLKEITGANTVEPDLATAYYLDDTPPPLAGAPGRADWPAWCWADAVRHAPADPEWAVNRTQVREAWNYSVAEGRTSRGEGIRVLQADTGVVAHHVELPPYAHEQPGAMNFVEQGLPPLDRPVNGVQFGHGTGTGSVIAGPERGRVPGCAPRATLVPIRCVESVAAFDQSRAARAIDHARRSGAHVISISLGGVSSVALHAAVVKAVESNIIVVAAAGNCIGEVLWPARFHEVIAAAGINDALVPSRGSCHGPTVDISAPAEFVLRANPRDTADPARGVDAGQGTSFAAAIVSGIAALWLAHYGRDSLITALPQGRRLQDVFRYLLKSTASVPDGFNSAEYGAGVVNALELLRADPFLAMNAQGPISPTPAVDLRVSVAELVTRVYGAEVARAARNTIADPQFAPELACLAYDRQRTGGTRRAHLESLAPQNLSPTLRQCLGDATATFALAGART
jgi:subtilisin family serine protease